MGVIENWKSSVDNIYEVDWVKQQVKEELNALTNNVEDNFFEKKENEQKVEYKMDVVKNYLNKLKDQVKDMDTRTAWQYLTWKDRKTAAWIMAVQIALESMWYDVERIDWILWTKTKKAVADFQTKNWLNPDSYPGKDTIIKLCDALDGKWWVVSGDWTEKPDGSGGDDWNKDKWNESWDKSKKYTIEKVWNKNCKIEQIKSVSELPEWYKWDDPENYDASKEDTYPTVYRTVDKKYVFYSNWRCKTPEWMRNTKDVVEELKNKGASETRETETTQFERTTVKGLSTYPFARVFDFVKPGMAEKLKKMNTLDSDWCFKRWKLSTNRKPEANVYFISNVDGKSHRIDFNMKINSYWEVDVVQFAKDVVTKIENSEKTTENEKREELNRKEFAEVRYWVENKLNTLKTQLSMASGDNYRNLVDAIRRVSRLLNQKTYAWNGKNVYSVYKKVSGWEEMYEDLRKKAQEAADKTRQKEK